MDADQGVLSPTSQQRQQEADAVAYVVHLQSMARSKCLLLSYMCVRLRANGGGGGLSRGGSLDAALAAVACRRLQRFERLKSIRWQHRALPPAVESMCSQQEAEVRPQRSSASAARVGSVPLPGVGVLYYAGARQPPQMYKSYDRLLTQHMSKHQGIGHDLTLVRRLGVPDAAQSSTHTRRFSSEHAPNAPLLRCAGLPAASGQHGAGPGAQGRRRAHV